MAEIRHFTFVEGLLLMLILLLAAGARSGYLLTCTDGGRNTGPLLVETLPADLDPLVANLKNQHRFAAPSPDGADRDIASLSPGYPVLTAVVGSFVEDAARPSTMRWLQCGLGTLTAGLYFLFARRAFRNTLVAFLAGLLCALHPFWILDTAALADGTAATFLLALALFLSGRASQTSGPLSSFLYGLALAALALVRAALLPFAFVALAWFLWRSRTMTRGWLAALLAFLGFVNGLAPWTVRNWQLFGQPFPIVNSAYYHLWLGNQPTENRGSEESAARNDRPPPLEWSPTLDGHYATDIIQEMRDRPAETVHRRLQTGLYFLFGERWFTTGHLAEMTSAQAALPPWLAWSYPVTLECTLLILMVLGLIGWRWTYGWRATAMPSSLAPIWIPLPYILSHAEALSGPRLPLDGVLLCYAAFFLACLFPGRRHLWAGELANAGEP